VHSRRADFFAHDGAEGCEQSREIGAVGREDLPGAIEIDGCRSSQVFATAEIEFGGCRELPPARRIEI
jgi:hypothetical protein